MIKFGIKKIKPYGDEREIDGFIIQPPHEDLSALKSISDLEDLDYFIEWFKEEVINADVTDYSLENGIVGQPILFGSKKSKIAKIEDGKFVGGQEFDTKEFLEVCYAWRDFLKENGR